MSSIRICYEFYFNLKIYIWYVFLSEEKNHPLEENGQPSLLRRNHSREIIIQEHKIYAATKDLILLSLHNFLIFG